MGKVRRYLREAQELADQVLKRLGDERLATKFAFTFCALADAFKHGDFKLARC
jgi:hypothetical protein